MVRVMSFTPNGAKPKAAVSLNETPALFCTQAVSLRSR